jgi:alcohol dehydrogenase (cytochrome c)
MKARVLLALVLSIATLRAQVSFDRIVKAGSEPQNWLTYGGNYQSLRYSTLNQITPANVKNLELKWVYQAPLLGPFQATPLVADGVLYTAQGNEVVAVDAATGRPFWNYHYVTTADVNSCCAAISRGLGMLGTTLFYATVDAHLVAIDARSGLVLWDTKAAKGAAGYSFKHAPLVIKDKVLEGTRGGEYGVLGFLAAFDAKTGQEVWRFNTVPGPGEPGHETWGPGDGWMTGAGPIWNTGSYDPELNLTYWGVGNPGPDYNGDARPGDNLYTCSVVALDADTGKIKWHYQFNPHDEFDWDAVQVPVLVDMQWDGRPRKVMMLAQRNGFFYVLDRVTGEFLMAKAFVKQNWNAGFDPKGRPIMSPTAKSSVEGTLIYPANQGGTNWFSPSYSPRTGLFYVNAWENTASVFTKTPGVYQEGRSFTSGGGRAIIPARDTLGMPQGHQPINYRTEDENYSAVRALDPRTGERKWEFKMSDAADGGILTTASDLLFTGNREGYFFSLDARTGAPLWKTSLGGIVINGAITYSVAGKQYVAAAAGNALFVFGLPD